MGIYSATESNGKRRLSVPAEPQPWGTDTAERALPLPTVRSTPENEAENELWAIDEPLLSAEPSGPADLAGPVGITDPRQTILALYDEFRPRLFRYMCSMHLGREQAEEVIQETFMRLTAALLKQTAIENLQGWIVRVAHNLAVDVLKKESNSVIGNEAGAFAIENQVSPALNPEQAYVRKEQTRRMNVAVSSLKPQHRQCFQMRAQGLLYKDIALALGISEQRAAFVVRQVAVRLAVICD